jgi:hypothetical protein
MSEEVTTKETEPRDKSHGYVKRTSFSAATDAALNGDEDAYSNWMIDVARDCIALACIAFGLALLTGKKVANG